ncbi:MAG TPA: DUF1684 domain-containing protein [Candidatus Eisenbacteria bacterium]|nr:DUF1684 domain-containing protein [Candidatus Eisenbacteria bacterium]
MRARTPLVVAAILLMGAFRGASAATSAGTAGTAAAAKTSRSPAATRPPGMSAAEADTLLRSYAKDRADTEEWLKSSPSSYLATIQRRDFGSRPSLTVGSDAGNDVRIEDPDVKPRHLRVTVVGDSFRVEALDRGARFKVKEIEKTSATLAPGSLKVGRYTLRLSHQRFPAIIVFDPKSPRFKLYKGLRYFPPDLSYHIVARLTPNPKPDTTIIVSTRGNQRRAVRVGWFDFKVHGTPCRLEATRLLEPGVGENDFDLLFTDATTGKESYGVGRYLNAVALKDGRYALDFNYCYNPACAYSDDYNCPIPPRANRLPVAIRAGEMDAHYSH